MRKTIYLLAAAILAFASCQENTTYRIISEKLGHLHDLRVSGHFHRQGFPDPGQTALIKLYIDDRSADLHYLSC